MDGLIRKRSSAPAFVRSGAGILAAFWTTAHLAAAGAATDPRDGAVIEVRAGETLQQLAARLLGDESAAGELRLFNRLETPVTDSLPAGFLLAVPGPIRAEARLAIATAAGLAEQARAADAATLSPTLFKKGMESLDRANTWLADAAYDRAASAAALALRHFEAAVQEADARSIKHIGGRVLRHHGDLRVTGRDERDIPPSDQAGFLDGSVLQTGTNGVAEATLDDSSGLFLEPASRVEVHLLQHDSRTRTTRAQLHLASGEMYVGVRGAGTRIEITGPAGGLPLVVTGGMVRVSADAPKAHSVTAWEADALLMSPEGSVVLARDSGARISASGIERPTVLPAFPPPPVGSPARVSPLSRPAFPPPASIPAAAVMQVELARDEAFLDRILRLPRGALQSPIAFAPGTIHVRARWAAAPGSDALPGPWSASWPLEIRPDLALTLAPQPAPLRVDNTDLHGPATTLHVTPSTPAAVVQLDAAWNDRPFAPATSPLSVPADLDGDLVLRVRATAETGETGPEAVWRGRIDRTGPEVRTRVETLHLPGRGTESRVEVDAVDPAGVERIEYRDPAGAWLAYIRPVEIAPPARQLVVRAVDRLGNASADLTVPVAAP